MCVIPYTAAIICKFRISGQTCVCANRIYVHSSIYAEFASRLADKVAEFKVGNGLEEGMWVITPKKILISFNFHHRTHGPLIHYRAVEKVTRHVEDAVSKGAQVLIGGKPLPNSNFFLPTILSDVPSTAVLNTEETFGPLAALCKFETEEEVIRLANDTDVGLAGYFFSRDVGRVWRVAERLEVGMVGANTGLLSQAVVPFGGVKESGLGREGGHGIEEYMNTKLIVFGGLGAWFFHKKDNFFLYTTSEKENFFFVELLFFLFAPLVNQWIVIDDLEQLNNTKSWDSFDINDIYLLGGPSDLVSRRQIS